MPKVEISNSKGLIQKTGEGLVAVPLEQSLSADTLIIDTTCFYTQVDPNGDNRSVRLEAGTEAGQLLLIENVSDAAETITFHADDFTAGAVPMSPGESALCVWNGSKWSPTSQTLS
jgi:hypothetical protein